MLGFRKENAICFLLPKIDNLLSTVHSENIENSLDRINIFNCDVFVLIEKRSIIIIKVRSAV